MTNAWIDDDLYREGWIRALGPVALHVYLAATNLIHREAREEPFLTRQELRDAYPWPVSDDEFEASIQRLIALERFVVDGNVIELPLYQFEQEDNAKRKDRRALNKINAAKGMKRRERDEQGRLIPKTTVKVAGPIQQVAGPIQRNLADALERPASGPVRSGPVRQQHPGATAPAATARPDPDPPPEKRKRNPKPTHPDRPGVMAAWDAWFFEQTGQHPTWDGRSRAAADRLADRPGLEAVRERLPRLRGLGFLFEDQRTGAQSCPDVTAFASNIDRLLTPNGQAPRREPVLMPPPVRI